MCIRDRRCTFQYFERNLANCHYSIGNNWILIGNKHNIRSWLAKLEDEVFLKLFQGSIRREIVDSEFGFANRGNFGTYVRGASDDGAKILRIFRWVAGDQSSTVRKPDNRFNSKCRWFDGFVFFEDVYDIAALFLGITKILLCLGLGAGRV